MLVHGRLGYLNHGAAMPLNTDEFRALVDAIALAPSADALSDLRVDVRREYGADVAGSFIELLLALRAEKLTQPVPALVRGGLPNNTATPGEQSSV